MPKPNASNQAPEQAQHESATAALEARRATLGDAVVELAAGGTLNGTSDPCLIERTVHQALALAGDPRVAERLARAHTALMAQANAISQHSADAALPHGFLNHIPPTPRHRGGVGAAAGLSRRSQHCCH